MQNIFRVAKGLLIIGALLSGRGSAAQDADTHPKAEASLMKLAPLTYPPLARQARIAGEVDVDVEVARDGKLKTATTIQGHPILAEAALGSTRQSEFECRNCSAEGLSFRLTYTF